jgi:tRNA-specific 2-thiouridylase
MTKAQVREVAERHRLPTSRKPESMEICFVPDGDYARFVERVAGPQPGGEVVDGEGRVLGHHEGVHRFTVGQRRGLGVGGAGEPLYVQRIDAQARQVVVGNAAQAEREAFRVRDARWVDAAPEQTEALRVRVRHRHAGTAARLQLGPESWADVRLETPLRGVTPGQAAVFYRGDEVLGGGWIA